MWPLDYFIDVPSLICTFVREHLNTLKNFEAAGTPIAKVTHLSPVRVSCQVTYNGVYQLLNAALDGFGLSYIPEDITTEHIAAGRLVKVIDDCCAPFVGFHLYYPSRRQTSPAFALLLHALRYRR